MKYLSFDLARLRNSDTWAEAHKHPWLALACFNLWCSAAERDGAGLPDDDDTLSRLAGVSVKVWKPLKAKALQAWRKEDGRWFHPVIEMEARRAIQVSDGGKRGAAKRWKNKGLGSPPNDPPNGGGNSPPNATPNSPATSPPNREATAPPNGSSPVLSSKEPRLPSLGSASARESAVDRLCRVLKLDHRALHRKPHFQGFPGFLHDWKLAGCDEERDVWPVIERYANRSADIESPKFFEKAIMRARDDRIAALPSERELWTTRLEGYRVAQFWADEWGPAPGEPSCRVPADILDRAAA